jgi:glycolate oxidase FAD binding subunit
VPDIHKPSDEEEISHMIRKIGEAGVAMEVVGGGTKRSIGRHTNTALRMSTENLRGVTLYEPTELVISALAGTPLATVEAELAKNNQHLAFEPIALGKAITGPATGKEAGPTIGGVFATNASGARRIYSGAARDHLLGIRAVNGHGEVFKSGGRVMKNVTGYDLCKTMTGTWGTLAVLTEVTMKVLPKPEETVTLVIQGLTDEMANEVLCAAMRTPYEISGCVHIQAEVAARLDSAALGGVDSAIARILGSAVTALRIENMSSSVTYRIAQLRRRFGAYGDIVELDDTASRMFWQKLQNMEYLQVSGAPVWRISTAPDSGHRVVRMISEFMPCTAFYDWSGGLIWLEVPDAADAGAAEVRRVVATVGGHATLIRANSSVRGSVEVFQPLERGLARLTHQLKTTFDPNGVLNPGRMYADI